MSTSFYCSRCRFDHPGECSTPAAVPPKEKPLDHRSTEEEVLEAAYAKLQVDDLRAHYLAAKNALVAAIGDDADADDDDYCEDETDDDADAAGYAPATLSATAARLRFAEAGITLAQAAIALATSQEPWADRVVCSPEDFTVAGSYLYLAVARPISSAALSGDISPTDDRGLLHKIEVQPDWGCPAGQVELAPKFVPATYDHKNPDIISSIQELVKALEAGGYNAAPTKLESGCYYDAPSEHVNRHLPDCLVPGAALQVEDMEAVMASVTFDEEHIKLREVSSVRPADFLADFEGGHAEPPPRRPCEDCGVEHRFFECYSPRA